MSDLEPHEIAVLLLMYDRGIIGKAGYTSLEMVRSKVKWQYIQSAFGIKGSFDRTARKLVKRMYLSDDGKSMAVLYLDKLGVLYVKGYLQQHPTALTDLEAKLNEK